MVLDRPEVINEKIKQLQQELIQSKKYYEYNLICDSSFSDDMIGFFNIGNARQILTLLNTGHSLQYRHKIYGNVDVVMNDQQNRIIVSYNEHVNENNIISYMLLHTGDWYLKH